MLKDLQGSNQEYIKVVSLCKNGGDHGAIPIHLNSKCNG